jgi:acetyl-CoA carboxylase biotin carboxyl carrier protein
MWQDKLKEIIYILENSNVNEIEVNFWGRKYRVSKGASMTAIPASVSVAPVAAPASAPAEASAPASAESAESTVKGEDLLSPMPGTFYASSTPDDPPFVSKGDSVKKGQTLCIIEAMKIMNEIEAEFDGTITDIKAKNGDPVEYNQTLFIINPS